MITRSELSLGAVRLLALYLIARSLRVVPAVTLLWSRAGDVEGLEISSNMTIWLALSTVVPLLVGIAMAVFSRRLARWVLPGTNDASLELPSAPLLQSIAIGTFGLFLIAVDLPGIVVSAMTLSARNEMADRSVSLLEDARFLGNLLSVAMGVLLLTGATLWSRLISMFRRVGSAGVGDSTP